MALTELTVQETSPAWTAVLFTGVPPYPNGVAPSGGGAFRVWTDGRLMVSIRPGNYLLTNAEGLHRVTGANFEGYTGLCVGIAPTISELVPPSVTLTAGTHNKETVRVLGNGFVMGAQIVWNGGAENTTFVSDTELTTDLNFSNVQVAIDIPVLVRNPDATQTTPKVFRITLE